MPKFFLTPKQSLAYIKLTDDVSKEIGYGGGAGGGKSILGCLWIHSQAIKYPGTAYVIGRGELTNLKKTTLLSFFQVLQLLGTNPDTVFKLNSQTNIITYNNGSRIFLMDMSHQPSDPLFTRFGGLELTQAFIDESNENSILAIEIIKTRLGRCKNKEYKLIPKLLETFNPDKNHVYHRYYKPWKEGKLPKHRVFITALATDNPYLDASYIEQLKNADKITRERLLHGNFEYDDDPTKLFEYDKILDIFDSDNLLTGKPGSFISCDVARKGKDKTVVIVWKGYLITKIYVNPVVRNGKFQLAQDNITLANEVSDALKHIAQIHSVPRSQIIVDEDGLGGGVVDMTKGVKGFVNNSSPIETQYSKKIHNYRNLKAQCYYKLAELVQDGKIWCYDVPMEIKDKIIEDLEQIARKNPDKETKVEVLGKEEMKERLGRSTDFSDAMMMRCYFDLKRSYKPHISI